jgi:glutaredoxin 3
MLTVYSKTVCPYCVNAKNLLKARGIDFQEVNIEEDEAAREFLRSQNHRTVPQIYKDGELFVEGGWMGLSKLSTEELNERLGR